MKKSQAFVFLLVLVLLSGAAWWFYRPAADAKSSAAEVASGIAGGSRAGFSAGPVSVTTVALKRRDFAVKVQATGLVTALNQVEIKPQVSRTLKKVHVQEGQFVKAGQLLFTLDTRSEQANVQSAQAQVAKEQAALADLQRQLGRAGELLSRQFISQSALDNLQTQVETQQANVRAAQVAVQAVQVNSSYGQIYAPLSGRIGQIQTHSGSTLQANATALATITQLDPIAVSFSVPQQYLNDVLQAISTQENSQRRNVTATLPFTAGQPPVELRGALSFVDNAVDPASGTIKLKATFANAEQRLWPGAFLNVELQIATLPQALLVPQASIVQGARGQSVFIVGSDKKAVVKPVQILHASGTEAVVTGLEGGERVVVQGRQNLRPGVTIIERSASSASTASRPARGGSSSMKGER